MVQAPIIDLTLARAGGRTDRGQVARQIARPAKRSASSPSPGTVWPTAWWTICGGEPTSCSACRFRKSPEVEIQTGDRPESLRGKTAQVDLRPGWSRQVKTPTSYVERAPEGQRDFMRRELECWSTETDPRGPKGKRRNALLLRRPVHDRFVPEVRD